MQHWVQLMIIRVLLGLFAGGALTLTYAIGGREMPSGAKVAVFGTLAGFGQIGGATSPFVTGALSKWSSLNAIFVVDAILYVVLFVWAWRMFGRPQSAATLPLPAEPALATDHD